MATGPNYPYNKETNPNGYKPGSIGEKKAKENLDTGATPPAQSGETLNVYGTPSSYTQAGDEVPLDALGSPIVGTVYIYDAKTQKNVTSSVAIEYGKAAKDLKYLDFIRRELVKYGQLDATETDRDKVLNKFKNTLIGTSQNQTDIGTYLKQAQAFGFGVGGESLPSTTISNKGGLGAQISTEFQTMFADPVPDDIKTAYANEINDLQISRATKTKTINGKKITVSSAVTEQEQKSILNKYLKQYAAQKISAAATGNTIAMASLLKGNFGLTYTTLKNAYTQNGIPINTQSLAQDATEASLNPERKNSILNLINLQAKTYFPALADKIDAGYTVKQLLGPYLSTRANILEEDPESIDLKQLQSVAKDPKGLMGLYDYEISLRKDPKWKTTKNALDTMSSLARDMTKMFGVGA